jgi:hypothetical protein
LRVKRSLRSQREICIVNGRCRYGPQRSRAFSVPWAGASHPVWLSFEKSHKSDCWTA